MLSMHISLKYLLVAIVCFGAGALYSNYPSFLSQEPIASYSEEESLGIVVKPLSVAEAGLSKPVVQNGLYGQAQLEIGVDAEVAETDMATLAPIEGGPSFSNISDDFLPADEGFIPESNGVSRKELLHDPEVAKLELMQLVLTAQASGFIKIDDMAKFADYGASLAPEEREKFENQLGKLMASGQVQFDPR